MFAGAEREFLGCDSVRRDAVIVDPAGRAPYTLEPYIISCIRSRCPGAWGARCSPAPSASSWAATVRRDAVIVDPVGRAPPRHAGFEGVALTEPKHGLSEHVRAEVC